MQTVYLHKATVAIDETMNHGTHIGWTVADKYVMMFWFQGNSTLSDKLLKYRF